MQDFTSNQTYDGLYKFPTFKDPDNDGVQLSKVSMGSGASKYFLLTDLKGIKLIKTNIPKISPTNKALETLTFPVSFQLIDKNKYPMSTTYNLVLVLAIKRDVIVISVPIGPSAKKSKRKQLPPLKMKILSNQTRKYLPVISDFTMTGLMAITLPDHVNASLAEIQQIPLSSIENSLNVSLRRGSTQKLNHTIIKTFKITKFEGRTLLIQFNFTDPLSISALQDNLDLIEVTFKGDPSELIDQLPLIYQGSDF